jgi:hypothetical protein
MGRQSLSGQAKPTMYRSGQFSLSVAGLAETKILDFLVSITRFHFHFARIYCQGHGQPDEQ